jgi:hypothetical protein
MRTAPFTSLAVLGRVFAKAIALLTGLNLVLLAIGIDPTVSLTTLNTWGLAGRQGAPRLLRPGQYVSGQLPLEGLLAAHEIAYRPKAADEFRVIVLGDSAQYGATINPDETLTGQLTARRLTVNGKRLVAYNLAFPGPCVQRDVLILDAVVRYQPDLVIWFVTATGLTSAKNGLHPAHLTFFRLNQARLDRIVQTYGQEWFYSQIVPKPAWYPLLAFHDQDALLAWLQSLMMPFVDYTLLRGPFPDSQRIMTKPIPEKASIGEGFLGLDVMPNEAWQFLLIGKTIAENAGAALLLVNEPMLEGGGPHSDVNYNEVYARGIYDKYRTALGGFASDHRVWYADLWNLIPPEHFNDTAFHADAYGWALVANRLTAIVHDRYEATPNLQVYDTVGEFRPTTTQFLLRNYLAEGQPDVTITFGNSSTLPVVGDWNGDGVDTIGTYDTTNSLFSLKDSNSSGAPISYEVVLGIPGDVPIAGDWDGDGIDGIGVFRPSNGRIYLRQTASSGMADFTMVLGISGDRPVAGRWDNTMTHDGIGVYRPSSNTFFLSRQICNCSVTGDYQFVYGESGDLPVAGDWNGDRISGVGVFRPATGQFLLRNSLSTGVPDLTFSFGQNGDRPVAGHWIAGPNIARA